MNTKRILIFLLSILIIVCFVMIESNIVLEKELNTLKEESNEVVENNIQITQDNKNILNTINEISCELSVAQEKIQIMQLNGVPMYFTEEEVNYIAKTVYGEARGCSKLQQSAVVWCILNRLENGYWGDTIKSVVTSKGQFNGYCKSFPVTEEIKTLVEDVLYRWNMEKNGVIAIGRTLPKRFLYFHSNGLGENCFTTNSGSGEKWDFNCWNPYD